MKTLVKQVDLFLIHTVGWGGGGGGGQREEGGRKEMRKQGDEADDCRTCCLFSHVPCQSDRVMKTGLVFPLKSNSWLDACRNRRNENSLHCGSGTSWCFSSCCSLSVFLTFSFPLPLILTLSFSFFSPFCSCCFVSVCFFYLSVLVLFLFLYWFSGFLRCFLSVLFGSVVFSLLPPACGASVLQVANQSAVSQEQVDNILQENDALRTNLAALEQVTNQENVV